MRTIPSSLPMPNVPDTRATPSRAYAMSIAGVCPVLATPFDAAGAVDPSTMERIVEFALRCGADAIVFPGVASEVEHLDDVERQRLLDAVAHVLRDRAP